MKYTLGKLFELRTNADFEGTVQSISEGVSLRGYNLWMLLCASMLASIGLDTNSVAIIIGAMLISPLMSPILGVGLSVAIQDKMMLLRSIRNLAFAVVISLAGSCVYFVMTPLGLPTDELQARTYPTMLDVLVALFGGLAGIISISRKGPTNAIPGVAIATALMPPLCTAGFGIATGNWLFFAGAFYLFFINAVFISMATFLVVRHLHFPVLRLGNKSLQRVYNFWFGIIAALALIPSIYFLYSLYRGEMVKEKISEAVITPIRLQGNEILKWETEKRDTTTLVKIYHSGKPLSDSLKQAMNAALANAGLKTFRIQPLRANLTKEEITHLSADVTRQVFAEMRIREMLDQQPLYDSLPFRQLKKELPLLFPGIDSVTHGWLHMAGKGKLDTIPLLSYFSPRRLPAAEEKKLRSFLQLRLRSDTAMIVFNPTPEKQRPPRRK